MMLMSPSSTLPPVAIVDPCCKGGYDASDLIKGGLGGTEATVLRVSEALRPYFDISLFQNGRFTTQWTTAGRFIPLSKVYKASDAHAFVVINRWKFAVKLRKIHPSVPIFLWLHVYPGRHNRKMGTILKEAGITVVCVSQTHAETFKDFLEPCSPPRVTSIYNPLADDLRPDSTPRDSNRLLFASSPHKGLSEVFQQFSVLRKALPALTLAVADPGYLHWETGPAPKGVIFLGSLSHAALIRQMRRSLCLFYSQTTFAETFGLVLAEANAVGTPTLVHSPLGANEEIVRDPGQLIDGTDSGLIYARIAAWQQSFPQIVANPDFRLTNVAQCWKNLLSQAVGTQCRPQEGVI